MKESVQNAIKKGQSLIEVLIALAVMLLVIVGLVGATTVSVRNADFSAKSAQAAKFAEQGLEKIRAYRDQSVWDDFLIACTDTANFGLEDLSLTTGFTRKIICTQQNPLDPQNTRVDVNVTVSWQDAKGDHQSNLNTYFTNWEK
jgi:Tfp pilus assembly protein PilV